jgi:Tfp pilus assembly protein PilV
MHIRILKNTAFSLLEILLAAVIFVISVAGVFATLTAVRVPVTTKSNQLAAAVFGKQVLEYLRSQVNTSNYYNADCSTHPLHYCNDLSLILGQHEVSFSSLPVGLNVPQSLYNLNGGVTGVLTYNVLCADGGLITCNVVGMNEARQVTFTIISS